MAVKVQLTIEQIADTLLHMKKDELESLELLLDKKTVAEITKRRQEARAGKAIALRNMKSLQNL
jgi:hypothetical protein